jgi:hypothetical protein
MLRQLGYLACLVLYTTSTNLFAMEIRCPHSISESPFVNPPDGEWEVVAELGERPLDQVSMYLFHPSKRGALVPDSTQRAKSEEKVSWRLGHGNNDEFWVGCSYYGTTAILAKKIDASISQCIATYELLRTGSRLRLKGMSCK